MDMRLVLVTHPSKEHAERITRGVIDAKLAACVLVTDVKSFYNWEGKLNQDDEVVTILKTSTDKATELQKYIETNGLEHTARPRTLLGPVLGSPRNPLVRPMSSWGASKIA